MMRLVIVGGSDAGISAALRARELDNDAEIVLVVADRYPNFSICGLPFYVSGETPDWRDLAHRSIPEIESHGVTLLLGHHAERLDPRGHQLLVRTPNGTARTLNYDRLVIATGAHPVRPPLPGIDLPGVHVLHTMDHSFALHDLVTSRPASSAVIIGAGYIGTEMADALTHRGVEVTLVEQAESVLTTVDPELGHSVAAELTRNGVCVATGVEISRIERDGPALHVSGSDGFQGRADLVLVAVGVAPSTELAQTAGVELGTRGAIRVDQSMRTGIPDLYAAGDCVQTWHNLLQQPVYLPLGTTAHKQGRVAGENAVGGARSFAGSLGTQVVKVFDLCVARTGLDQHDAETAGLQPATVDATFDDHKAYYPGATQTRIRVTASKREGRLLGAQLIGHTTAQIAKRVDIYAAAIHHRMAVEDLNDLDLSYTPPYSSPWDPVQMAAQAWQSAQRTAAGATR